MERRGGQVLVEVLLTLPVFLLVVFTIMEIGHLAFRTILLHHAAYEVARYGSLIDNSSGGGASSAQPNPDAGRMNQIARRILPDVAFKSRVEATLPDLQEGRPNYDVVVELSQSVPMIFPMTGLILGNDRNRQARRLSAAVRMPIERPLFKGQTN